MNAQMMRRLDWSDLPYVLAVCEAGGLAAAARALGVNHSTVYRRVEGVEARLGVRLFHRQAQGYAMTAAGEAFYQQALSLRDQLDEIELQLSGSDVRLEGELKITTTDSLAHCLGPTLVQFQDQHPEIDLHLIVDARPLDLMRREADVALRPTPNPPETWIGKKLLPIVCGVYAQGAYWQQVKDLPASQQKWIVLDKLDQSPMSQVSRKVRPTDAPITTVNSVMSGFDLLRTGVGMGVLPTYLGEKCPDLVRIDIPEDQPSWDVWLLSHPDVRRSARVHAFFSYAAKAITADVLGAPWLKP